MSNMSLFISSLYYGVVSICGVVGIYLLYINGNRHMNKIAFMCCLSLSCWYLGVGESLKAFTYADSLVWQRLANVGVGTFFSFFLHFIMIITENKDLLKKRCVKCILYIPSLITVYFLVLSKDLASKIYYFEVTPLGWVSKTNFHPSIIYLYCYIISFMLSGFVLLYGWYKNTKKEQMKKQAKTILVTYLIGFFAILLAQILMDLNVNSYLHQLAPLSLVIPMLIFCYVIKQNNLMSTPLVNEDIVFMEQFRTEVTQYLSLAFCIGGVINIVAHYLHNNQIKNYKVIWFSLLLFLFGFITYIIHKFFVKRELKIILYAILLSISIPIITLHYMDNGAITVWAFPFIILVAALLFNNTSILIMVSSSMILTQLYMWINDPALNNTIDTSDYFTRIGLMGMAIWLTYYINKVYLIRLSQLSDKIRTQDLLFTISSRSINVNSNNLSEKMEEVLGLFCEYANADRAHVYYKNAEDGMEDSNYYCWCNFDSQINHKELEDASIANYSWWINQINETGIVQIPDVSLLLEEAVYEKEFLTKQKVKSLLAVPLTSNGNKIGFIRIDFVNDTKKWNDEFIKLLVMVGNVIGEANIKATSERKMEKLAYYDQLTNIPNRQLFSEYIDQTVKKSEKSGDLFSIIFLDLDSFKIVNDTIGHHFGDEMLIMIANRLVKCLRKSDFVCRFGGDEFLIMLNDIMSNDDIQIVVNKIVEQFEKPFIMNEQEFFITASIGISVFPVDGLDKDMLIKNADIAMYKAKDNGKNQFVFCSQEMKDQIQQTMLITNNLYHAQERNELDIVYQPQVCTKTGKVIAVEALVRWNHKELGAIPPGQFIPIAEHTGLINSIGEWVLFEACKQNKAWKEMGLMAVRMAVNVSVKQLLKPKFVDKVIKILEESRLDPHYLELEVTENIAIQESSYIFTVLSDLRKIGISIAIDDFGTQYSSLNRIKTLPIDRLKIDMHFITGILNNEKDKVIVDVIIKLAKDLNLKVIAEGVEEEEQLDYLKLKKCDEIQGYYFYKPLSRNEMEEVLLLAK